MKTSLWLGVVVLAVALPLLGEEDASARAMVSAARNLLAALANEQRTAISYPVEAEERFDWHYVPKEQRKGLSLAAMEPEQVHLTHVLLNASLSRAGYAKTATIMSLESVLRELETALGSTRAAQVRDPLAYFVTVFGTPAEEGAWGFSLEGHHVSLNFTMLDGEVAATSPAFLGANPHSVPEGPRQGLRPLGAEEDRARRLLESLDEAQRGAAILADTAPRDIFSAALPRVTPEEPRGLAASSMSAEQVALLHALVEEYIRNVPEDVAEKRRAQLAAAGEAIHFAWMGSPERGEGHYYRVQAPDFLIEYDNVQNDANHSHTVWRDYDGDFGRDLIAEHRRAHPH